MKIDTIFKVFENERLSFSVNSSQVISGDIRLDSSHFIDKSDISVNENLEFLPLTNFIEDIEEPTLFTRIYCDEKYGVPYISSSEMSELEPPVNSRFISKKLTNNINQYVIKRGQILVSAAGTVGSIVVATEKLDGVAGTSDILRINVDTETNFGFVFTYLTSSFGASELENLAYGAIIKRVRGYQLAELKTPVIDNIVILKMNNLIKNAMNNRDKANNVLQQSRSLVLKFNLLPVIYFEEVEKTKYDKVFEYSLTSLSEFTHDYRLDAHYYKDIFKKANENVLKCPSKKEILGSLTNRVFIPNRFNRIFVDELNGIRMIGTRNMLQIRPIDFKYISSNETSSIDNLLLTEGMILLSRSGSLGGTFGKVCFVKNNFENYAGSEDIIRICPNIKIDSGYLYSYLSTGYGYFGIIQLRHGAIIDHISPEELSNIQIPLPSEAQQKEIGDLVRQAYDLRAEAIRLEDEAQELLTKELTKE